MSSIEELQQRVVQAEERFGLINAERAKYSERLMGLIDAIETRLGDQQSEIERQASEANSQAEELTTLRQGTDENKLLRGMLQSLLNAIELGNSAAMSETMQVLDTKISALVDADSGTAEAAPSEAEVQEAEPPAVEVAEAEAPEVEAVEAEAPDPAPEPETAEAEVPEPEAAEAAAPEPEPETTEAEVEIAEAEIVPAEAEAPEVEAEAPEVEAEAPEVEAEAEVPEPEAAEATSDTVSLEEKVAAAEPEAIPEAIPEVAEEAAPEPVAETEPAAEPEVEADAEASEALESPLDEADAVPDVPVVAGSDEQKPEASSLEDIMRRVSKLVEDEGALEVQAADSVEAEASAPSPAPAEEQKTAAGG